MEFSADPLSLLGEISLGIEAVRYAKAHLETKSKQALADELRSLYFDRKLFDQISVEDPDWDEIESSALKRLFDSRNAVADALIRMENAGFLQTLSLKNQRIFQQITRSKRIIRTELIDALRSSEFRNNLEFRRELLAKITELNGLIEDLETGK